MLFRRRELFLNLLLLGGYEKKVDSIHSFFNPRSNLRQFDHAIGVFIGKPQAELDVITRAQLFRL